MPASILTCFQLDKYTSIRPQTILSACSGKLLSIRTQLHKESFQRKPQLHLYQPLLAASPFWQQSLPHQTKSLPKPDNDKKKVRSLLPLHSAGQACFPYFLTSFFPSLSFLFLSFSRYSRQLLSLHVLTSLNN